jgi:hypothetical protein
MIFQTHFKKLFHITAGIEARGVEGSKPEAESFPQGETYHIYPEGLRFGSSSLPQLEGPMPHPAINNRENRLAKTIKKKNLFTIIVFHIVY